MTVHPQAPTDSTRKRRAHKKSRQGCRNCKIRSVKCDETKPRCLKCTSFGVACNYDAQAQDLQSFFDGTATIKAPQTPSPPVTNEISLIVSLAEVPRSLVNPMIISDFDSAYELDSLSLERLFRFQQRTVLSVGNPRFGKHFQSLTLKVSLAHPFVMHIVQTITSIHDRYLTAKRLPLNTPFPPPFPLPLSFSPPPPQPLHEIHHLTRAASLFHAKLSGPILPSERDALWSAASLLGIITFSWIDAPTPFHAWPLRPSDPGDLEWLRFSEQKSTIWKLTDPLRPGGAFAVLRDEFRIEFAAASYRPTRGTEGIPRALVRLCGLTEDDDALSNVYFDTLHVLSSLLEMECTQERVVRFLNFIAHMPAGYRALLQVKDARALLLLAYWYAKVVGEVWWMEWRAIMECQAVCLYLEKWHGEDEEIVALARWPRRMCGLDVGGEGEEEEPWRC